jgi:hypothetical protein
MICPKHNRWSLGDKCAGCEGLSIAEDTFLIVRWDSAAIDGHEKNSTASKYRLACWHGDVKTRALIEKKMLSILTTLALKNVPHV